MEYLMQIIASISFVTIALLIVLLSIYIRIYRKSKAEFTLGLIFFAGMLMLHNVIAIYAYFLMAPLYNVALLPYFVAIHGAEVIGIAALLRVTI
jgi:uncharacterized membrane protein YgdD (TMEM256/DUF423 family)